MWFGLINTAFFSLASTNRTSAAIADLHACAKDTLKCWPENALTSCARPHTEKPETHGDGYRNHGGFSHSAENRLSQNPAILSLDGESGRGECSPRVLHWAL
jgi:hypothetical protein